VNASLDQLHTSGSEYSDRFSNKEDEAAAAARIEKEQQAILQVDDIVEFDSDEEMEVGTEDEKTQKHHSNSHPNGSFTTVHSKSAYQNDTTENDPSLQNQPAQQVKPATHSQPIKRIVNPYKTQPKKTLPQLVSHVQHNPGRLSQETNTVTWSRQSQAERKVIRVDPTPPAEQVPVPQPPTEAIKKSERKVILMDV
jgi:hypothetical protein